MKTAANYDRHIMPERQTVWNEASARGVWTYPGRYGGDPERP